MYLVQEKTSIEINFMGSFGLVGGVEKWEDIKWWEDRKYFNFPHFCLVESGKVEA